ncbi:hypothetical protein [Streptomyces chromofuscus]|uniref:Extensin n=1 Tax=Streptomyces chromofuscus TaxID=42881 RepID=A0A7M2T3V1_STRCW|nr:hypothetical protein [Streptomyces chromofuscus]QOV42563.1 hypothetical protein IPT68_22405 [Streptomyces chromofuscus]GGT30523.1 hypothetical protein GCM10010254_58830 [Streptomyces chromofuscus]
MADEQYRWLNRETAERLLSGEPLDAVGADGGEEAARLARTLGALSADPPLTSDELPGEAAALAAFRKVRADRDSEGAAFGVPGRAQPSDAGLMRIGGRAGRRGSAARRRGRGRPVRLALAAALAVVMVGGVAVAAGTGVLGTPFLDDEPGPAASVTAAESPQRPSAPPAPTEREQPGSATSDGTTGGPSAGDPDPSGDNTSSPGRDTGKPSPDAGGGWSAVTSACRDLRDGRTLDDGRKRALNEAAGGSSRVQKYCDAVLGGSDGREDEGRVGEDAGGKGDDEAQSGDSGDSGEGNRDSGDDGVEDPKSGLTGGSAPRASRSSSALAPERTGRAQSLLPTPDASSSLL